MKRYDKSAAQNRINLLASRGIPFVFAIDFEMKKIIISEVDKLDTKVSIQFPDFSHGSPISKTRQTLDWIKNPITLQSYEEGYDQVMNEIKLGNTFLLNLAYGTDVYCSGGLEDIYHLADAKYKMYLKDEFTFFSPETFVKIKDGYIYTYPMKGTIDASEENALQVLLEDTKEIAEHYTIVDLLRNDLSLVAHEVEVTKFRYPDYIQTNEKNLIQISSEIRGKLPKGYIDRLGDVIFKMLPAGSISGAPKNKTLDIISQVERDERGYYTGICGYFDGTDLDTAVMIRYVEDTKGDLVYKSGCGITFQSDMEKEYDEMLQKIYIPVKHPTTTYSLEVKPSKCM